VAHSFTTHDNHKSCNADTVIKRWEHIKTVTSVRMVVETAVFIR